MKSPETRIPTDLAKALAASPKIKLLWDDLTPLARRDFISWIVSAKQLETRKRRIQVACSKLMAGKRRPCCYAIVPMNLYKALGESAKAKAQWSELTAAEKRDFVDWIEEAEESVEKKERVDKTCRLLERGKRRL